MWDWLKSNHDQIISLTNIITAVGATTGVIYWIKSLRSLFKNFLCFFIVKPVKNILSWTREKIVGKENLELLKELEVLKDNKRAIEILGYLSSEDKNSKVNSYYEALLSFMCLYSFEMDFNEFKEAYEKDEKDRIQYGAGINVDKLRVENLKKLIKKYSK